MTIVQTDIVDHHQAEDATKLDNMSYEQLLEYLLQQRMNEACGFAASTAVSRRVQEWSERVS